MTDYRCPYCFSTLSDADTTRDNDALRCADCGNRVEYFDAIDTYEESVSQDDDLSTAEVGTQRGR